MELTLRESVPSADPILPFLFGGGSAARGPDAPAAPLPAKPLFPGGHFQSEAALQRRLNYLDAAPGVGARLAPAAARALLQRENAFAPLHPAQELNLDLAGKHGTVFVLTGQQPGLLGGPILWLYKALTAAALAEQATRRLGRPVIPVFWVAGDDSDLRECNHLELLEVAPNGFPSVLSLPFPDPGRAFPVGARPVDAEALAELFASLGRLWKPGTLAEASRAYTATATAGEAGGTLADAFLRLAQAWLGPRGMLFLNGFSPALRSAARPALERAVAGWPRLEASLARGTAALQAAGLETQVALRQGMVHAFALQGGERRRLFAETGAGPGRAARLYTAESPAADFGPGLAGVELTHDVFTRPLVAETLLPVLGHVLGPAELRYFAQLAPAFLEETGDMPLLHPRRSAAVASSSDAERFAAEGLSLGEAAALKPSDLLARLREKAWQAHPAAADLPSEPPGELLEGLRRRHARHFRDTGPLERLERSLQGSWRRYLASLGRMAYADASRAAAAPDLIPRLRWLGNGGGQDRHLNLHSLLDAVGREGIEDLIGKLGSAADAAEPGARIFTWEEP